jgi:hypothetical protein
MHPKFLKRLEAVKRAELNKKVLKNFANHSNINDYEDEYITKLNSHISRLDKRLKLVENVLIDLIEKTKKQRKK